MGKRGRSSREGQRSDVRGNGQIVVGPFNSSTASTVTLDTAATSYNIWGPSTDENFIITDILIYANKNVGVNDATLVIYESTDGPATGTQSKILLNTEMVKQTTRDLVGLNLKVTEGSWVNAETDDDDVFLTVMGYYSPAEGDLV
jgi:hypothetical protein